MRYWLWDLLEPGVSGCEENGRRLSAMILSSRVCVEYGKGLHTEKLLWFIVNLLFGHGQIFSSI